MALSSTGLWSSLVEVKPYLKLGNADVSHDAVLEDLCNAVSEEIELATGRIYLTRTVTSERHSGDGTTRLALKYYPVTSVTSITQDSTTVDTSYYWLDGDAGVVWRDTGTWTADEPGNILVTYVAGCQKVDTIGSRPTPCRQTSGSSQWIDQGGQDPRRRGRGSRCSVMQDSMSPRSRQRCIIPHRYSNSSRIVD